MRFETKLVKIGSRSALVGGGERDRLLDDRRTPEIGWLISHNRPGLASASPPIPCRDAMAGLHMTTARRSSCAASAARQAAGDLAPMSWPSKRWPDGILVTMTVDVVSRLAVARDEL